MRQFIQAMLSTLASPIQRQFDFARRTPRAAATAAGWVQHEAVVMGTAIRVELWADDRRAGEAAAAAVIDEMHRIDRLYSPHKPASELSRINREAGQRAVPLTDETCRLLQRALEFSAQTGGAFDITTAAVGRLYDYRAGVQPAEPERQAALAGVGWRALELDPKAQTLRFARPGMCIDLGGFAKGYAVDNAAAILRRRGVRHAWVSAGGDSRVMGERVDARGPAHGSRPWSMAIRDPREAGRHVAVLPLVDASVSTSGDYERGFDADGQRVHHLIDPATGRSAMGAASVTVVADAGPDSGLVTEALGKALFVLGATRGLALIEGMHGIDAVIVDTQGRLHASPGLHTPGEIKP
jgi:FAD:protein FMN transferase